MPLAPEHLWTVLFPATGATMEAFSYFGLTGSRATRCSTIHDQDSWNAGCATHYRCKDSGTHLGPRNSCLSGRILLAPSSGPVLAVPGGRVMYFIHVGSAAAAASERPHALVAAAGPSRKLHHNTSPMKAKAMGTTVKMYPGTLRPARQSSAACRVTDVPAE